MSIGGFVGRLDGETLFPGLGTLLLLFALPMKSGSSLRRRGWSIGSTHIKRWMASRKDDSLLERMNLGG